MVAIIGGTRTGGGDPAIPAWISGNYYDASHSAYTGTWAGSAVTALRCYATLLYVPEAVTISEVGINVTAAVASSTARVGLAAPGADHRPGALYWQSPAPLDTGTTGEKAHTGLSLALAAGWWWQLFAADGAISVHQAAGNIPLLGYGSHSSVTKLIQYFKTLGSLALPDPFGTPTGTLAGAIRTTLRVA